MARQGVYFHQAAVKREDPSTSPSPYACVAGVWAAIAYGASLAHDSRSNIYAENARSALQRCFDRAAPETVRAYLLVEAWNAVTASKLRCIGLCFSVCFFCPFVTSPTSLCLCLLSQLPKTSLLVSPCSNLQRRCGMSCEVSYTYPHDGWCFAMSSFNSLPLLVLNLSHELPRSCD